jgi:lipopolysaccharide/colanic/teichoic acid biosynthesis glycosyltransferase
MKLFCLKRLIFIIGVLMGHILSCPFIIVTSVIIYFTMGRLIFFNQIRPGLRGNPFMI